MQRLMMILAVALMLLCGCDKKEEMMTINDCIAECIGTKAEAPLEQTIWEYTTGERFNQYLYFDGNEVKFFYGCYDVEEGLLRYTDFYTAPYELSNGVIKTEITYPNYGETEHVNQIDVIVMDNLCQISIGDKVFEITNYNPADIYEQWVEIIVGIYPWE